MAEQRTSATGGYLSPDQNIPQPLEGDDLIDFFQAVVVGITGLDGSKVRPRWQPEPPNLPPSNESWMAIGCTTRKSDTYAVVTHEGQSGEGADLLQRQQFIDLLCSAYGPQADSYLELLRDGLQIAQNREQLFLQGMAVTDTGDAIPVPTLTKDRWLYRVDMRVSMTRQINRRYPILNLQAAEGVILAEEPGSDQPLSIPIVVEE